MVGWCVSSSAFSFTICLPSNLPFASWRRIHFATSFTEELTPPAGDCASGSRLNFCTHLPSTSTCTISVLRPVLNPATRELVARHTTAHIDTAVAARTSAFVNRPRVVHAQAQHCYTA